MLGRTIDDLEESQNFCPEDIDFKVALFDWGYIGIVEKKMETTIVVL